uniref:E3 ubiquitin-protein ligase TRIM39-like n=1 Tax=Chelydra serpentina TaxID=8475 RepID=A0A8C3TBA6_CHESE
MAAADPAKNIKDEVTCSICLDLFKDPVTAECGHSFCRECITQHCEEKEIDIVCPQCRQTFQKSNLRPNRELKNIVELINLSSRLQRDEEPGGGSRCEKHDEPLKLFCKNDQTPICVICRESRAHRAHTVVPMEEAVQECRVREQSFFLFIKIQRKCGKLYISKENTFPKREVGGLFVHTQAVFHAFTRNYHEYMLTVSMLESSDGRIVGVTESVQLFLCPPGSPFMGGGLCPKSDPSSFVRCGDMWQDLPNNPERFDVSLSVLGSKGFTSGRHYWEVEVGAGGGWAIGIARDSVRRKGGILRNPEEGIWVLTSAQTPLSFCETPKNIGIFLDYTGGEVTFYNAETTIHLLTCSAKFTGKIVPFFRVWAKKSYLKLSPCQR